MTIEKIKHYMGNDFIFDFWCSVRDAQVIKNAIEQLENEINSGLLVGIQYQAELQLLKYLAK